MFYDMTIGREVKTPDWLQGKGVCPVVFEGGNELWWENDYAIVKGEKPEGTFYRHPQFHTYPATYGPKGEPVQVVPDTPEFSGSIAFRDVHGDIRARAQSREVEYIEDLIGPHRGTGVWFAYPLDEDNRPQLIACFQRGRVIESERGVMEFGPFDAKPVWEYRLFALVVPIEMNFDWWLDDEAMASLPRFEGAALLQEEG
jgi:hypothetical protein